MMSVRRRLALAGVTSALALGAMTLGGAPAGATAPANVTALTASSTSPTSVTLNWTNPTSAGFAGAHICRNFGTTAPTSDCAGVNVSSSTHTYTDTHQLIPNTQYTYAVFAYNTTGQLAPGAGVTVTTQQAPAPSNVTGLGATAPTATSVTLTWTNPTSNFAGVYICRGYGTTAPTYPCGGVKVAGPATTYTDSSNLIPNTQYTYTVFASNAAGTLSSGASVTVTTPSSAPPANVTHLTAQALSSTSIQLNWTNPTSANFAGVFICRGYGTTAPTYPCGGVTVAAPTATFTDSYQLIPNTKYTYTVFASTASGVLATGTSVTVTTPK
jgi:predicted phage tail protein